MIQEDECIILDVIEAATSSNWPNTKDELVEMGYNGAEVAAATGALAELAHRLNPFSADDF